MNELLNIINEKGYPKAIVDYKRNFKKAIFDFDEILYMDYKKNIFINDKKIYGDPIDIWQSYIDSWKKTKNNGEIAAVGFFSYDFKNILLPDFPFKMCPNNKTPYFWFAKPSESINFPLCKYPHKKQKIKLKQNLMGIENFDKIINKIKKYLYEGEVYQINFTQPIIFDYSGNAFDLYIQIYNKAIPEFGFFLDIDDYQVLSFSPEKFFTKDKKMIKSYPIKGTIKRLDDRNKDYSQIKRLKNSSKDKAEHLMIVDLLRNDIGKIAEFGSVKVNNLFNIKTFETIHHMESEVVGKPLKEIREIDIIKSLFPGGSITGAPKYRAMQIIDSLENYNRGLYTGCIGTIMGNGDMDFNICIRTMTINNNTAVYPVGGGIVWDSTTQSEFEEAKEKANILNEQ